MSQEAKSKGPAVSDEPKEPKAVAPAPEKYFRVKFHAKSNPNDEEGVILSVNGEVVIIERQKEVVLPERFIVCAQNACYPQYHQSPGHSRKVVGEVHTHPFDMLGEGTEAEYRKMKREGTKASGEAIKKDGVDAGN